MTFAKTPFDRKSCESGNPVWASGKSEKAGPQVSSSSDCSSSVVGNLATGEYTIRRSNSHLCNKIPDLFCHVCGEFEPAKNRRPLSDKLKKNYEESFQMEVENEDVQMEEGLEKESSEDENPEDEDYMPDGKTKDPEIFNRAELNDLIRDLNLPKAGAELLASRLKNKNLLAKKQYVKKDWPTRVKFNVGTHNVIRIPLIQPSKYLLPPLHIKLCLIKQYVKALDKNGDCFQYLKEKFPAISDAKLKEGIFNGPQIRTLQDAGAA
ncbi:hypothetical protein RN001_015699 [Aquatica leii]|uniref:Uncharacterized protein n=1 Tax=Aquatica leii TaxID=1421715 RepID=A0AAN7SMS0_9COLE|nr:hypothetical protein RN001_015699 [Aquatica leii]